jgi:predicted ATPase
VGEAIEQLFKDHPEDNAHRLAQHFATAGDTEKAYRYYVMAGEAAAGLSANAEAADHFAHALRAAEQLPIPPAERVLLEQRQAALAAGATAQAAPS